MNSYICILSDLASESINGEMSEWISTILDGLSQSMDTDEVISSEELLSYVDELVDELEKEGEVGEGEKEGRRRR